MNAIRAHLAEFGIVAGVGRNGVDALLKIVCDGKDNRVPEVASDCLDALGAQRWVARHRSSVCGLALEISAVLVDPCQPNDPGVSGTKFLVSLY